MNKVVSMLSVEFSLGQLLKDSKSELWVLTLRKEAKETFQLPRSTTYTYRMQVRLNLWIRFHVEIQSALVALTDSL